MKSSCLVFLTGTFWLSSNAVSVEDFSIRTVGPEKIYFQQKVSSIFHTLTARSLLICYARCLELQSECKAVSFGKFSKACHLADTVNVSDAHEWATVRLSEQVMTSEGKRTTIGCPSGFENHADNCYYIETKLEMNLWDAVTECEKYSAELVSIETELEQRAIEQLITDSGIKSGLLTSGKGLGTNSYEWFSTGRVMDYEHWADGQPDGDYSWLTCVILEPVQRKWRTASCDDDTFNFICEFNPTNF